MRRDVNQDMGDEKGGDEERAASEVKAQTDAHAPQACIRPLLGQTFFSVLPPHAWSPACSRDRQTPT